MERMHCSLGGCRGEVDQEGLLELSRRAQDLVRGGVLEEAVEVLEEFLSTDGADKMWGFGFLQNVLELLLKREVDPGMREALEEQVASIGQRLLAMDDGQDVWVHRWERARQLNNRAWAAYERARTKKELARVLEDADESVQFWPYFLPHQDTRVRILLRLGREDEAYRIVRWVAALQPGWPDFEDVVTSAAYKKWERRHRGELIALPEGPASHSELVTELRPLHRSAADEPLNDSERLVLRLVRVGPDEWHRARNSALLAVLLDGDLPVDAWLELEPRQVNLSQGLLTTPEERIEFDPDTLSKLRHWLLYGATNHPSVFQESPPPGIRARLFLDWDLRAMTRDDVEAFLAELGERLGIEAMSVVRMRPAAG